MAYYYSNQSYAYQLGLYVTTVSQSVENNTSTIYWRLDLLKHSSAYSIAGGSAIFYVAINGVARMNESIYFAMSSGQTSIGMRDGYVTIPHGSDGNAAFGVAFSFTSQTSATYFPGSMSGSGTYTCAYIARATTPTLSADTVELGSSVTITASPATSTFSHKLYYQIGNAEKVSISTLAAGTTTYAWTVPEGIADSFTASTSGTVSVVCETYSGDSLIGTRTVNLTVTIPATMVPTISSVTIAEATAGLAAKFGAYVQGKSTLSIATSASGVHGSTIDSIAVDVGGTAYSGASVTTGVLNTSGSVTVTVTVTDSRGRTAVSSSTVSVTAYSAPTITVAEAVRCDSDGTVNEEGTYIKFTYKFNVAPVGDNNDKSFKIQYKNGNTWTDLYTVSAYTGDSSYVSTVTFSIDNTYDVRFVATDYFSTTTIQKQVAPSFVLMDFGAGGKSMAIGQRSSDDGSLETALPFRPYGGIHSHIAGVGMTSNAWIKVFSIRIIKTYSYGYFAFSVLQAAGGRSGCRVELQIGGGAIASQAIQTFCIDNRLYMGLVRAYKSDTDTFDIYVKKQGNASIPIYSLEYSSSATGAQVIPEFVDEEASLPSGAATPTWYGLHAFPIGATFESTSNANPGNNFGGTWTQIQTQETLTVSGSKVVSVSGGRAQMHTTSQIQALFNEKYGFTPTFSGAMTSAQASAGDGTAGDAYLDLGAVYTNGDLNANGALVGMGRGTDSNDIFYVLSTVNGGLRVNYTYITHRTMYKWTRTA